MYFEELPAGEERTLEYKFQLAPQVLDCAGCLGCGVGFLVMCRGRWFFSWNVTAGRGVWVVVECGSNIWQPSTQLHTNRQLRCSQAQLLGSWCALVAVR